MADYSPPWLKAEIPLPFSVESIIETICREQSQPPPGFEGRRALQSLGEEQSLEILNFIRGRKIAKTFHGFILCLARQRNPQPQGEITTTVNKVVLADGTSSPQRFSPQFRALEGLEFSRLFLILSYIGRNKLEDVVSVEEIQSLRACGEQVSMGSYESLIWNQFGQQFCEKTDRLKHRNWDPRRRCYYYHCHVYTDGGYAFKGPFMNQTTTLLHRALQDENILIVKFSDDIQSAGTKNEDGSLIYSEDGKLLIQTDGTGFISEDLALRCPRNCHHGSFPNDPTFEKYIDLIKLVDNSMEHCLPEYRRPEPPLLIQFRMFHKGRAVKGTVLVNKQLPEKTIQIRPSMIKVQIDPELLGAPTINSFEIVSTSNRPKKPHFSRFLIALLHFGGVPKSFFTDILDEAVGDAVNVLSSMRGALRVALVHGEVDDEFTVARMLLSGISLEEPYIQWRLLLLANEEKKSLKEGRLPIKESFYLMGTADPIGCLEEDEVCIIHENGQLSGDVLVYRNPGIHFGDVRVLKATHKTALEDIVGNSKYGIFFSTKGPRSPADQLAGGDYDGDMYWISRNPDLLRYFIPSEPWTCNSSSPKAITKKPTDFSADDLEHELFHLFLSARFHPSKFVGVAADSWLSYMDRLLTIGLECVEERNLLKEKMLKLVDIYYDALDAPKKGVKVEVPHELIPKKFPHYMGRGEMFSYRSTSVLGEIFDKADELKLEDPSIKVWKLPSFEVEIPGDRLRSWECHYKAYRSEMSEAMQLAGDSKKETAADVMQKYKQILYEADNLEKSSRPWEEIRVDALAAYHVTYDYAIKQGQAKYCGFAWRVAGLALVKAFVNGQDEKPVTCLLSVLKQLVT